MVRKSFGRSLSFPIPSSNSSSIKFKNRLSLPCRLHPFIAQLDDEIHDLLTWHSLHHHHHHRSDLSSSWIVAGLDKLGRLHESLDDLLQHPRSRDPLCRRSSWTDRVLDDFLRFADAYGSLRTEIVALKDRQAATQAAVRREDGAKTSSCVIAQRRAEKELGRIAAAVKAAGRWGSPTMMMEGDVEEAELAAVMREVAAVTVTVTAAVIGGLADVSAGSVNGVTSSSSVVGMCGSCVAGPGRGRKKEGDVLEKLEALEKLIGEVEKRSNSLFRSLVKTRVFLLNIFTPNL